MRSQQSAAPDCGCRAAVPEVLATVNGVKITRAEIDAPIATEIQKLEAAVIDARTRELDLQINSQLLNAEAKKRGLAVEELLKQEVVAKALRPTEAEALTFYQDNKERIAGEFASVKDQVIEYLLSVRQTAAAKKYADQLRAGADLKIMVAEVLPPAAAADRARVLATVLGTSITSADIEDSLRPLVIETQKQIYQLRADRLGLRINDLLLEQEAQKRKLTTRALLASDVDAKLKPVAEADAQSFYDQNKAKIVGEFAQVKADLIKYLEDQGQRRAELAFADQLRQAATIQMFIVAPAP